MAQRWCTFPKCHKAGSAYQWSIYVNPAGFCWMEFACREGTRGGSQIRGLSVAPYGRVLLEITRQTTPSEVYPRQTLLVSAGWASSEYLSAQVQWHSAIALAQVSQGGQQLQRPIRAEPCRFRWVEQIGASSVAQRYCKKPLCYKAVGTFRGLSTLNPAGFFRYTSGAARSQGPMASHSAIQVAPYGLVLPCLTRQRAPVSSLPTRTLLVSAGCCTVEQISGGSAAARSRSVPSR